MSLSLPEPPQPSRGGAIRGRAVRPSFRRQSPKRKPFFPFCLKKNVLIKGLSPLSYSSTQYVSCVTTFTIISDKLIPTTIWDTTVVTSIVTDVDSETVRVIVIQPSPIIEAVEFTQKLTFTAEYVGTSYHISTVDGRTQTSTDKGPKTRIDGGTSSPEPTDDLQRPPAPAEHTDTPEGPPADPIGEYSQPAWTKTTADVRANGNGRSGWVTGGSPFTMSHTGQNTTAVGGGVFGPASGTSTQNNSGVPPAGTTEGPFFSGTNVALSRDVVMASFGTSFLGFAFAFIL